MTVRELIKLLATCNQDAIVKLADWGEEYRSPLLLEDSGIFTNDDCVLFSKEDDVDCAVGMVVVKTGIVKTDAIK